MACDTFLKISQKCKRKFMTLQAEESQPFILTLISDLGRHIKDLQTHQIQSFYESAACMLSDKGPSITLPREEVIVMLMDIPNQNWRLIMNKGSQNIQYLFSIEVIKEISRILKINMRVCASVGSLFIHQLSIIFLDILNIYKLFTEQINQAILSQGEIAVKLTVYKSMRGVKSDILELFTIFFEQIASLDKTSLVDIMHQILPNIMKEVLSDYHSSPAPARDPGVLNLFSVSTSVFNQYLSPEIPNILDAIFEPTLQMITKNMLDYPEHRIGFFKFLRVANEHCFQALFNIPIHLQKLIIDSIVWAFKHTERNISETGLEILLELLENISRAPNINQPFYQQFLLNLIQDIFSVMTDRLHKSGFRLQASLLMHILHNVQLGAVTIPLFDVNSMPQGYDNSIFLKEYLINLLVNAFPNMIKSSIQSFIFSLFNISLGIEEFKQHVRDFLISCQEFASEDNSELFIEEAEYQKTIFEKEQLTYRQSVPGLVPQIDLENDPDL
jgi:exportin-1